MAFKRNGILTHATTHMNPENMLHAVSGKRQSSVTRLMKLIRWTNSFISRTDYENYERSCSYWLMNTASVRTIPEVEVDNVTIL